MRGLSLSANYSALVTLAEWSTSWTNKTGHDPVAPAGPQEGDLGRRCLHPDRHLPHAQGRHDVSPTSAATISSATPPTSKKAPDQALGRVRLRPWNSSRSLPEPCLWQRPDRCGPVLPGEVFIVGKTDIGRSFTARRLVARAEVGWCMCKLKNDS